MTQLAKIHQSDAPSAIGDELPPGTELCNGQYVVEKYLNCGGFGITYLARDSLDRKLVIKECFPNAICCRTGGTVRLRSRSYEVDFARAVDLFKKEARALAGLAHPNIVGVHQIFEANGTAYMALDFIEGMDLLDLLDSHPEVRSPAALRELAMIMLQALAYVHDNGILHRDISPDNILLDMSGKPILIDFGAARKSASQASRILSRVYTVKDGYSPQEFYFAGSAQSPASDLYALAATLFHLIEGTPPPNSSLRLAAAAEDRADPYVPLRGRYPAYDDALLASIDRCMSLFSKDRLATAQDWIDEITGIAKASVQESETEAAKDIARQIARMVEKNRQEVAELVSQQASRPQSEARISTMAQIGRPRQAAEKDAAYWAILNEDLSDEPKPSDAEQGSEPSEARPAKKERRDFSAIRFLGWFSLGPRRRVHNNI